MNPSKIVFIFVTMLFISSIFLFFFLEFQSLFILPTWSYTRCLLFFPPLEPLTIRSLSPVHSLWSPNLFDYNFSPLVRHESWKAWSKEGLPSMSCDKTAEIISHRMSVSYEHLMGFLEVNLTKIMGLTKIIPPGFFYTHNSPQSTSTNLSKRQLGIPNSLCLKQLLFHLSTS